MDTIIGLCLLSGKFTNYGSFKDVHIKTKKELTAMSALFIQKDWLVS
jgi:hypothetical protein